MSDTKQRRPRATPDERASALATLPAQYKGGATIRDLATQVGRSYGWVHRVLAEAETEFRQRGGNLRKSRDD
jgi:hypothetical protein